MEKLTTTQLVESTLSKLGAVRWYDDKQVLYDSPSREANEPGEGFGQVYCLLLQHRTIGAHINPNSVV